MEKILEKEDILEKEETKEITQEETKEKKTKKEFTILGLSIWKILAYFIIYSVFGYIVEMIFSIITKGTLESRQSFLYGPFSGIYGLRWSRTCNIFKIF